ncbi:hypothetical protein C922_03158 [Plasmodium inui San Antonio 1]|uniref:Uncharacterized protein n=1 Tax=Plasmodium inui San Antonio 1 TaxID=1237626 RepID=W7ABU3_9APIC|nr:hypothetical protein C922_03158 [Plasmodium inui San Antonio 1]EUD66524.1 hypothetical protein C922_03158 [Plasmodium inui San Antonio 1]
MTRQHPHGSSENVLEYALLAVNHSRINCVQKNVPFEESYLIKKKKHDHLLDLKFCHLRRGSTPTDSSTSSVGEVSGEVGGGGEDGDAAAASPACQLGNLGGILPSCNRARGRGHSSAYFILRQWCEKLGTGDGPHREANQKRGDNLSDHEDEFNGGRKPSSRYERTNFPTSYVVIGTHQHGNSSTAAPCSYEEMTVEIPNYDVEVDGFYVQIHVDPNEKDIFILSCKELILIRKKKIKKNSPIRGEYLLHNRYMALPSKRKIIKAEWFHKSDHVVSLLTYEHVEASKICSLKFKSVLRLINVEGEAREEVKIVIPDVDIIHRKLRKENLEDIKKDLYKMGKINSSLHLVDAVSGKSGTEQMQTRSLPQYHDNNAERVESFPSHDKVNSPQGEDGQDRHTNMSSADTDGEGKKTSSSHPISSDLAMVSARSRTDLASDHVLMKEKKQLRKNKYKNLVVDYCFGAPSENIPWIETCVFVLLRDGLILIYTPIITSEWYVSYFLMHELNRIRQRGMEKCGGTNGEPFDGQPGDEERSDVQRGDGESLHEEYAEDFLAHYDHFRGVSVRQYRENDVWVSFDRRGKHAGGRTSWRSVGEGSVGEGSVAGTVRGGGRPNDRRAGAAFSYAPYVVNCLRSSTYRSIGLLYCNHLVFIAVSDKFGYVSFVLLNYFLTPHIVIPTPGQSETDSGNTLKRAMNFLSMKKKKQSFFFNIFNLNDNAIFENLTSAGLANLINRDRYDEYYRRVKNGSYEIASLMGKMSQRGAARECTREEEGNHRGGGGVSHVSGDVVQRGVVRGDVAEHGCLGTSLRRDPPNEQRESGANLGQIKIDVIKLTKPRTQKNKKKSLFKERFTKNSDNNEKEKYSHSPGFEYTSDGNITEQYDFFSCYEDEKEILEKQINDEVDLQCHPLSVLYFDSYYTGMSNVKMIVLNKHNLLCFNNEKVVHLHLVWLKFVSAIFSLIHLKNILSAKLIHEMCKNGLYMSTTIFKAPISFYQFDYYAYLLLDHTKRLNHDTFSGIFGGGSSVGGSVGNGTQRDGVHVIGRGETRDTAIQWEGAADNFDCLQSSALYDVQYVLHPVVVQESSNGGSSGSITPQGTDPPSDVYFIFTHYVNLDSQRKEKLFMSRNINFFTSSVYKKLFLIYDCFKFSIVRRKGNPNLSSQGTNRTHFLLREKRKCKPLCPIPRQARLRNFYITTQVMDDDSIDLNTYENMLSLYVNSRCNDYMNSLIKKSFIFYQGKGAPYNVLINRDARATGVTISRSGVHTTGSRKMITHMSSGIVGANYTPRLPYYNDSNYMGELTPRSAALIWDKHGVQNGKEECSYLTQGKFISNGRSATTVKQQLHSVGNQKGSILKGEDTPNAHSTEEIDFLKHIFVILHSNENDEGNDIHRKNPMCEESSPAACKKYNCGVGSITEEVNPEKLINDIKVHVLKGDSKKYDNVPCTMLLKKLIKVKNDYIHVKDYFLKKKKINLDSLPSDVKGKINFLEQVVLVYYFFLDLNFYYENKFEKIKKRIIHSLGVDVIHFVKSHASVQSMSKALIERNTTLVKDIELCYQKHQLIREKFNLLKKKIHLHSLVKQERFPAKWEALNAG